MGELCVVQAPRATTPWTSHCLSLRRSSCGLLRPSDRTERLHTLAQGGPFNVAMTQRGSESSLMAAARQEAKEIPSPFHDAVDVAYLCENPTFRDFENFAHSRSQLTDFELLLHGKTVGGFKFNDVVAKYKSQTVRHFFRVI